MLLFIPSLLGVLDKYNAVLTFPTNVSCETNKIDLYFPSNVSAIVVNDIFFTTESFEETFTKITPFKRKLHAHSSHSGSHSGSHSESSHSESSSSHHYSDMNSKHQRFTRTSRIHSTAFAYLLLIRRPHVHENFMNSTLETNDATKVELAQHFSLPTDTTTLPSQLLLETDASFEGSIDKIEITNLPYNGPILVVNVTMWSESNVFFSANVQSVCQEYDMWLLPNIAMLVFMLFILMIVCSSCNRPTQELY